MAAEIRLSFRAVRSANSGLTSFRYYLHVDCTCRLAASLVGTYATEELALADNSDGYAVMRCTRSGSAAAPAPAVALTPAERAAARRAAAKAQRDADIAARIARRKAGVAAQNAQFAANAALRAA